MSNEDFMAFKNGDLTKEEIIAKYHKPLIEGFIRREFSRPEKRSAALSLIENTIFGLCFPLFYIIIPILLPHQFDGPLFFRMESEESFSPFRFPFFRKRPALVRCSTGSVAGSVIM